MCTSWNRFRKDGCRYEFLNPGKSCRFLHHCSKCKANGLDSMSHKEWQCSEFENSFDEQNFLPENEVPYEDFIDQPILF